MQFDYVDVTNDYLVCKKLKTFKIKYIEELYVFDNNHDLIEKYTPKNALFRKKSINEDEAETIKRLKIFFGWKIYKLREVDYPLGIKTPDIKVVFKDHFEYWEIKNIGYSETANSRSKKVSHIFDKALNQSDNIIIDINKKECDLTNQELTQQILIVLKTNQFVSIKRIIAIGKDNFIRYFKR